MEHSEMLLCRCLGEEDDRIGEEMSGSDAPGAETAYGRLVALGVQAFNMSLMETPARYAPA